MRWWEEYLIRGVLVCYCCEHPRLIRGGPGLGCFPTDPSVLGRELFQEERGDPRTCSLLHATNPLWAKRYQKPGTGWIYLQGPLQQTQGLRVAPGSQGTIQQVARSHSGLCGFLSQAGSNSKSKAKAPSSYSLSTAPYHLGGLLLGHQAHLVS